ncbi:MAG: NAD-dependent epimerase [Proteobacteria bacterium]|nr:MAG: NAD-dependent epimerase [Pseudomonadota bacterium]PIE17302.1 MAG: NAD-dependent epimerase [Pseudomonadota bacterium]
MKSAMTDSSSDAQSDAPKIILTGISSRLGLLIAQQLHRLGRYRIIGIDRRPVPALPKDIEHLPVDIRSKRARDVFRHDAAALVHAGMLELARSPARRSWNVLGTSRLLEYCEAYGVPKVVILSSAEVYGARPDNHQFLREDAPLLGASDDPELHELVTADMQATSYFWRSRDANVETVVLRPVHILGQVDSRASLYLRRKRVPLLLGYDPMVQVIHEADVVEAVALALQPGVHGVFNVAGPGELPLHALLEELGKPMIKVPYTAMRVALNALGRLGATRFSPPELAHLRFVAMVDGRRAQQQLGFRPRHSLHETIAAVLQPTEVGWRAERRHRGA